MARRTAIAETETLMAEFFADASARLTHDITKTRQWPRRRELLHELDALDKVKARFYDWKQGKT